MHLPTCNFFNVCYLGVYNTYIHCNLTKEQVSTYMEYSLIIKATYMQKLPDYKTKLKRQAKRKNPVPKN